MEKNLKKESNKNSLKSLTEVKDLLKVLTGGFTFLAVEHLHSICRFWNVAIIVCGIVIAWLLVRNINNGELDKRGKKATRIVVIITGIITVLAFLCFINHKVNEVPNGSNDVVQSEITTTDDTEETETEETETQEEAVVEKKVVDTKKSNTKSDESPKLNCEYAQFEKDNLAKAGMKSELGFETTREDNESQIAKDDELISNSQKDNANVNIIGNNITTVDETKKVVDDSKEDLKHVELDKDDNSEVGSSTEEEAAKETEKEKIKNEEANKDIDFSDDELNNAVSETNDYVAPAEGNVEVEDVTIEDKIEIPAEDVQEEVVEEVTEKAISVSAVDGYETTINSTVQFMVSGDNVVVDGLDGISYSLNNGVLNVNVGSEATVLTVELTNSVSSVSFDIVVNGVVNQ